MYYELFGDKLMIFNKPMKNAILKLCGSTRPWGPIAAIVFCRTSIRLKNPSFSYSYQFMSCSLKKIQDTKFRWCVLTWFEHFMNMFQTYSYCLCKQRSAEDLKRTRQILTLKKVILSYQFFVSMYSKIINWQTSKLK